MYFVKLETGAEVAVQIAQTDRGRWRATSDDGATIDLEIRGRGADDAFIVVVDGVQRVVRAQSRDGELTLIQGGTSQTVEVTHAADLVLESSTQVDMDRPEVETLCSPITGILLQVPVSVGDRVNEGDGIVVVEAMKMENSLGAPRSGTVLEVFAKPGQTVFVGDPLVKIK